MILGSIVLVPCGLILENCNFEKKCNMSCKKKVNEKCKKNARAKAQCKQKQMNMQKKCKGKNTMQKKTTKADCIQISL
jgi:hypothetical protein